MWRPEGWKCPYLGRKAQRYFELGADAMLKVIEKETGIKFFNENGETYFKLPIRDIEPPESIFEFEEE